MTNLNKNITLQDACDLIGKSNDAFAPLKESITNAFDAIIQRQNVGETFCPLVSVSIYFKEDKDLFGNEILKLDSISVEDNGIGFTSENFNNFQKLGHRTKGLNNRGTGIVQIFCRFKQLEIESIYVENGKWNQRNAMWLVDGNYKELPCKMQSSADRKTVVKMSSFYGNSKEQECLSRYIENIDELKRDVLKHFLLRLWLGNVDAELNLSIRTFADNNLKAEYTFKSDNIPKPDKEETVDISTEQVNVTVDKTDQNKRKIEWLQVEPKYKLTIHRFKMPSSEIDESAVYLCSKDIMVEQFKFPAIKRKDAVFDGHRYLSGIRGDIFDNPEFVSHTVDSFTFPSKKETEASLKKGSSLFNHEDKFVFRDEINSKIDNGLTKIYDDIIDLKKEHENEIAKLAKQYGISSEDAASASIGINEPEEEATKKLFETQARRFAKENIEIKKTYDEIKDLEIQRLNPTGEDYKIKLGKLIHKLFTKIPQQNKDELTRYVIRRDMVVNLLKLALANGLEIQKEWVEKKSADTIGKIKLRADKEGIIHDMIFKRRMKGVPNDLWILNEEYVHFEGCSEHELKDLEMNGKKLLRSDVDIDKALESVGIETGAILEWRPDIFLYPEEGKCILVEFKSPDVELTKHCDQIQKYAKIIANYAEEKFTQFYGYLIGEQVNRAAMPDRYQRVPYGNYWVYASEPIKSIETDLVIANLYQEIMPLSEIAKRAEIRNKSFAEKLGLPQSDSTQDAGVISPQDSMDKASHDQGGDC